MKGTIDDLVSELIRDHHAQLERRLRRYIRENHTLRLDIELVVDKDASFAALDDTVFLVSDSRKIRQRLPRSFRPAIP